MLDGGEVEQCLPLLLQLQEIITTITMSGDGNFITKYYVPYPHLCR